MYELACTLLILILTILFLLVVCRLNRKLDDCFEAVEDARSMSDEELREAPRQLVSEEDIEELMKILNISKADALRLMGIVFVYLTMR